MKNKTIFIILVLLLSSIFAKAQNVENEKNNIKEKEEKVVSTRSWKKGDEKIIEQTLRFNLSTKGQQYDQDIISKSGKTFRLTIAPNVMVSEKGTHWKVELREISSEDKRDLINFDPPNELTDYFPRERLAGYYYADKLSKWTLNGKHVIEKSLLDIYPIETTRKIKVEGFWVIMKAENINENEDGTKSFDLIIEFTNSDEKQKD